MASNTQRTIVGALLVASVAAEAGAEAESEVEVEEVAVRSAEDFAAGVMGFAFLSASSRFFAPLSVRSICAIFAASAFKF